MLGQHVFFDNVDHPHLEHKLYSEFVVLEFVSATIFHVVLVNSRLIIKF